MIIVVKNQVPIRFGAALKRKKIFKVKNYTPHFKFSLSYRTKFDTKKSFFQQVIFINAAFF